MENIRLLKFNYLKKGFIFDDKFFNRMKNKLNLIKKKIFLLKNLKKKNIILENYNINILNTQYKAVEKILNIYNSYIPNIVDQSVIYGYNKHHNIIINKTKIPKIGYKIQNYLDLGIKIDAININDAVKITQSHFCILQGNIATFYRTLSNFILDYHTKINNYYEINVPCLVNEQSLINTGQLPKFKNQLFKIQNNDLFLIPTGEVPIMNIFSNKILDSYCLPKKIVTNTSCFRNENGYGILNKGLIRTKQFDKIELVKLVEKDANKELEYITYDVEKILKIFKLPYRRVLLCSKETGFTSFKTYDIEVWFPSIKNYVEISSCSNINDFQSKKLCLKYKNKNGTYFLKTLNASGLPLGRLLAAILENYQQSNGKILIPKIIKKYYPNLYYNKIYI